MAWKDGFVIEYVDNGSDSISCYKCMHYNRDDRSCNRTGAYVPEIGRNYWITCTPFELADDYNTVEMREKADRARARARNKEQSLKHNAAKRSATKKKNERIGSSTMIKGLHVGRTVCNSRNKLGHVKTLTNTTAIVEFEDGTIESYMIPNDFRDGRIRIFKHYHERNDEKADAHEQEVRKTDKPCATIGGLQNRLVYSSQYGQGIVIESQGAMITVVFAKGLQRVKFDVATAIRKQSLRFGPIVERPMVNRQEENANPKRSVKQPPKKRAHSTSVKTESKAPRTPKPATKQRRTKNNRSKANAANRPKTPGPTAKISDALDSNTLEKLEALKRSL